MMKMYSSLLVVLTATVFLGLSCTRQAEHQADSAKGKTYVTRTTLEPDKLASIWLIKRYLDPEATFEFVDDSTPLTNGIPFDTVEAEFRRYAHLSCFESILKKHPIPDPAVRHLGALIHDLEINYWGEKRFAESAVLNREIQNVIQENPNHPPFIVEQSCALFDRWLLTLQTNRVSDR